MTELLLKLLDRFVPDRDAPVSVKSTGIVPERPEVDTAQEQLPLSTANDAAA